MFRSSCGGAIPHLTQKRAQRSTTPCVNPGVVSIQVAVVTLRPPDTEIAIEKSVPCSRSGRGLCPLAPAPLAPFLGDDLTQKPAVPRLISFAPDHRQAEPHCRERLQPSTRTCPRGAIAARVATGALGTQRDTSSADRLGSSIGGGAGNSSGIGSWGAADSALTLSSPRRWDRIGRAGHTRAGLRQRSGSGFFILAPGESLSVPINRRPPGS